MRSTIPAVAAVLLASGTTSAFAAPRHPVAATPTYETCYALAMERAQWPNQGPSLSHDAPYNAFMRACLAGKIPLDDKTGPVAKGRL